MSSPQIGGLNEKSLHRELKNRYTGPESSAEESVAGYVVDVVSPGELVEIQTGSFSSIKNKLTVLLRQHNIRLVYPIAAETIICVYDENGILRSKRRSPKRGTILSAASELLYIPELLRHPGLTVEVLLVRQEEIRRDDGNGSWRRKGISIEDRRLIGITGRRIFSDITDYLGLLPDELPSPFGNKDISERLEGMNRKAKIRLAGQITWLLRKLELIEIVEKDGNRLLFKKL